MCGIAGIFEYGSQKPVDGALLQRMTRTLAHRGPDGEGVHFSRGRRVGLGHRRLSIIDLQTGGQPMSNADGTLWITYNGEIYNYRELREDLKSKGYVFKTASDTEVILHGYEEWGEQCVRRFNGIFAFCLWNEKKQSLYLARDHFGVKPLYYHDNGKKFLFASEIKSLLQDPDVSREIDLQGLHLCLTLRYTPSPWTLFAGVRKLGPSFQMVVDENGVRSSSYGDPAPSIDRRKSEREWVEELAAMYVGAVHRQMVSDVPIGLSLSSGVDSNALLALMSARTKHVHTFTVGFEGNNDKNDEVDAALKAAVSFDAVCDSQIISEADYISFMESYLWHLEEPVGNESAAAYYFVAKLAQPKVKVLLSGQGADEPFGGYPRHRAARYARYFDFFPRPLVRPIGYAFTPMFRGRESPGRLIESVSQRDEVNRFLSMYSITTPRMRNQLFNPGYVVDSDTDMLHEFVRNQLARAPEGSMLERMTYIDARTSLSDNLLMCGDKMAMATSVEMRVPFLDLELMNTAERIPGSFKVQGFRNKAIHKLVCERWLAKKVVHRRKIGFNEQMGNWLKKKLEKVLTDLVAAPDSITQTLLNPEYVARLQREHSSGQCDHHRLLFLLLSIETWRKVFR